MKKTSIALLLSTLALTTAPFDAQGCSESMFHSGQGMRYHTFITRQPANILVYRPGLPIGDSAQKRLDAGLENAGHHVTLVTDAGALTRTLSAERFDIVIANAHDVDLIAAQLDDSARKPALLAVLGPDADKNPALRARFAYTLREQDGLNQYLKLIEQTMQGHQT